MNEEMRREADAARRRSDVARQRLERELRHERGCPARPERVEFYNQVRPDGGVVPTLRCTDCGSVAYGAEADVGSGPLLRVGELIDEIRETYEGSELQVISVKIFNAQDVGGESATARGVVPYLEAVGEDGNVVTETVGVWRRHRRFALGSTADFRPTREAQAMELVAKWSLHSHAYLPGREHSELPPGRYTIRAALRGDGLAEPATFEWIVVNPGAGEPLTVEGEETDRAPIPNIAAVPAASGAATTPVQPPTSRAPAQSETTGLAGLIAEGEELQAELWQIEKSRRRSGFGWPILPSEYLSRLDQWNRAVLALADERLSARESAKVAAVGALKPLLSTKGAEAILDDNLSVLRTVRARARS